MTRTGLRKRAKYAAEGELLAWLPVAIEFGQVDALPLARAALERRTGDTGTLNQLREVLAKVSGAKETDAELTAWLRQNERKVIFDRAAGRFVPGP